MESITPYFRESPSDKVYQASFQPKAAGFLVHFAYGRRGFTLSTGRKTQTPVAYQIAKGIYDKLIKDKLAKGYRSGAEALGQIHAGTQQTYPGIQCQLLKPIQQTVARPVPVHPRLLDAGKARWSSGRRHLAFL